MSSDNIEDICELSAVQQGMLFHSIQGPRSGVYVVQMECSLHGALDAAAFERAWQRLVDAHAMLRTSFVWERVERPLQVVQRRVTFALDRRDWTTLSAAEQEARLSLYLEEDRRRGFDPTRAPLMRAALFSVGGDTHRFVWTHHHILLDGWSVALLLRDVLDIYEAELHGRPPPVRPSRPFSDYVGWQERQDRSRAEAFWRGRLRELTRPTDLDVDRALRARPTGHERIGERRARLDAAETARLTAAARRHRLTLATVVQGAWGLLLSRYSGEEEVVFGSTVSTRPPELSGFERIVGPCINTLPVRLAASPSRGVAAWLSRLQEELVEARPHAHVALVDIQRWSDIPRGAPLFESIVAFENYPVDASLRERGAGFTVRAVRWIGGTSYPLAVIVLPDVETTLCLQYHEPRFSADAAARMLDHYREILRGIARGMDGTLVAVPMLTEAERRRVLVEWNDTAAELPLEQSVHAMFEAQARRTPDDVAAASSGAEITYDALDRRANRLSRHLRARGVGKGSLVGILIDRSLALMTGLLGVLKAGGAFVPLDPSHPRERLARVLSDAKVSLVLARQNLRSRLPEALSGVILLDTDWPVIAEGSDDDPAIDVTLDDLAYVLYTSGSTGGPKGVMVPHRGLVNYLGFCARTYPGGGGAGAPVHTSIAFDLTLTALFAPLVVGGRVELLPEDRGVGALAAALRSTPVPFGFVKLTPSHVELVCHGDADGRACRGARAFVVGGESLSAEHVAALCAAVPGAAIFNEYGPTEAVVGCCVYRVPASEVVSGRIPIGRPIDNTQLYILDQQLSPVPIGVPGELYIGGAGLARGYLGRPDLTAERFIRHPFDEAEGARLYRTGDRARYLPDGNIEFLGRLDQQVKIRGFRIEPAEIEAALEGHPAVREAAVVAREGADGALELVACWVPRHPAQAPPSGELRRFLLGELPEPMVPTLFAKLDRLPRTPNGKTDRALLLAAPTALLDAATSFVAPRTDVEEGLAEIWTAVLGVRRVGVHDDFLELGGHSLSALRVLSRVRARFRIDLPLQSLFEARTLSELAVVVERAIGVRPRPGELENPILPRRPEAGPSQASFAQQRLWVLDQLDPGSPAYNVHAAVRIEGPLDVDLLERSIGEVVRRHEVLRATFEMREGRLVQQIAPVSSASFALRRTPLTAASVEARWEEARHRIALLAREPFDLREGPLLRASLLMVGEREHALLLAMHHIVSDGWSRDVLVREIAILYEAGLRGASATLPELPIQVADFAAWQRARVVGELGEAQIAYWKRQLSDLTALELPADRQRPPAQSFQGAQRPFTLPGALRRAIEAFGRERGVTVHGTLLAAFVALLHRYTAAEDIAVGSPVAVRSRPETEGLIGPLINTVVLRCRPSPDTPFSDLVEQISDVVLAARAHADVPFERVVSEIGEGRDESRNPLFQVLFDLQHPPALPALPGLRLVPMDIDNGTTKVDLALHLWDSPEGLQGSFEYSTDLFEGATIARMLEHFQRLLEGALADGRRPLSALPLLGDAERREVLFGWNDTRVDYPEGACLHRLFEAQVERTPDAVAITFDDAEITYRELNRRANRLAHHLAALGVGPETVVGVHLDRSVELVVALLGILKAGGAYLPLEPGLPRDRLAFMIEDAAISVLLTRSAAPDLPCARSVHLDDDAAAILREHDGNPRSAVTAKGLAYVIYTSGSTGQPKGVMIQHDGIYNRLFWMQDAYRLSAHDRVLQKTPIGFDVSVWEIFWPLLTGARMVLARPGRHADVAYLIDLVVSQGITTLHFVPSLLRAVVEQPSFATCASLERVFCSGEALSRELSERLSALSRAALHNLYGPTEASVDVTSWTFWRGAPRVLIGRPIANIRAHILDARREPVPVGVPGELHLGGVGLARGYLGRPELTAERFIPDPFSGAAGERLYRTGDRCRYLEGGDIEFLGRLDDQVKIRGVRVEPGEVEAALMRHPRVSACIVIAREDEPGGARLFAYVVSPGGRAPSTNELRCHLAALLPEAMIPAAFIPIDAIPRTASGKVDRRALPRPTGDRPTLDERYAPPESPEERVLSAIWSEVLGVDRIGVHDDFFALGGDSMRAIQVVSLARQRGLPLSLRRLLREPTIRAFAGGAPDGDLPLRPAALALLEPEDRARVPAGVEDAYPLTLLQLGMVFHDAYDPAAQLYRNVDSVHVRARFDPEVLRDVAQRLVGRHEILRTSFDLTGYSEAVQIVHAHALAPLTVEDLRDLPPSAQEAHLDAWFERSREAPIDVTAVPLFRLDVHRRGEDTFQLTLPHHHAILDGWSVGALFAELMRDYLASLGGERRAAPPIEASFRDYVALERGALVSSEHRRHWAQTLTGAPATTVRGFPDIGPSSGPRHRELRVPLGVELSDAIAQLASSAAVSRKSVLLAAHVRVLSLLTGQSEVVTGVATDGRPERPGGDRVLGLFLNSVPFRVELRGGTWMDLVREVSSLERASSPFRHYPLARIERDLEGRSLFDTLFNYTHFHVLEPLAALEGLDVLDRRSFARSSFRLVANFDVASSADRGLELTLAYDVAELGDEQVEVMGDLYRRTLAAMTSRPLHPHESDYHFSPEERRRLLATGNDTRTDYPRDTCLHRIFEARARRAPDAPAVRLGDELLGYGELCRRADRLARLLRSMGVGPETRVGVCLERSFELVIGLLAVLKAGGAYVPLDPSYPEERLAFMLRDAGATTVLAQRRFAARLEGEGRRVVVLDEAFEDAIDDGAPPGDGGATAEDLAYVMYTSGSTGTPKGVCIPHRAVARLILGVDYVTLGPDEIVLQLATIAFDAATFEIWGALLTGALLVLLDAHKPSLAELAAAIERYEVTTMFVTPAVLNPLVEAHLPALRGVRQLIIGGDVVSPAHALTLSRAHPGCLVINGYGPTESTTFACCHPIRDAGQELLSVPIGRPIANTRAYVCDRLLEPVPIGVPGELFLGGDGLARGYLNRPDWTAERFVPDPFSDEPGARLYRTGDRVRRLPNGDIEFLGRVDHQVKIRGVRVELGEIEAVLRGHPAVRDAVVVRREEAKGAACLAAYVVLQEGSDRAALDLRAFLAHKLPEPMVPSAFVVLEALPLTESGKLDRAALPAPERARPELRPGFVVPRAPSEEILAGIVAELLGIEHVGIHDDLFELGANSLTATQIVSRVHDRLKAALPLRAVFDAPTIAGLAAAAAASRKAAPRAPIAARPREGTTGLSVAQEQLFWLDRALRGLPFFNMPAHLHIKGPLHAPALARSLDDVMARHEGLRTTFDVIDGRPAQIVAPLSSIGLTLTDLRVLPREERAAEAERLARGAARARFDLTRGPLIRAELLRLDDEEHVLLLTMHHILGDGWSMGVLMRDVAAVYEALVADAPPPLPPLPLQYADFAAWQTDLLASGGFDAELAYWRRELAPPLARLALGDGARPSALDGLRTSSVPVRLPRASLEQLRSLARSQGMSLFMVLLAALYVILHRATGQHDIRVGTLVANRTSRETEDLIGLFINTVVLRADLSGDPTFREILRAARDKTLAAYDHQDVPFEAVLHALSGEGRLDRSSVFQAMLVLQNAPMPRLAIPDLEIGRWQGGAAPPLTATGVDLTLVLDEDSDGLAGSLIHRSDQLDAETIDAMRSSFEELLSVVAYCGDERLSVLCARLSAPLWRPPSRK